MSIVSETNDGVKCVEFSEVIKIDEGKFKSSWSKASARVRSPMQG